MLPLRAQVRRRNYIVRKTRTIYNIIMYMYTGSGGVSNNGLSVDRCKL